MDAYTRSVELAHIESGMNKLADTLGAMIELHRINPDREIVGRLIRAQAKAKYGAALVREHRP
jgi:hypothetical protein